MAEEIYHIPALLEQSISGLAIQTGGTYVDVTFGGGGHSRAILQQLGQGGHLLSFDQDMDAYRNAVEQYPTMINDSRWQFVHGNFRFLKNFLRFYDVVPIDGLIADLGVSFHHFDSCERGFSFRFSGPLDMRMNQQAGKTASEIINTYTEEQLSDIFYIYGELKNARRLAKVLVQARTKQKIERTEQLTELLTPLCGRDKEKKDLARVFQALRIEVNDEMGALKQLLYSTLDVVRKGGRIAILTYHSLEDRMVKNFFKTGNIEGKLEKDFYGNIISPFALINTKVITASEQEVEHNPRARSAKLRIAEVR